MDTLISKLSHRQAIKDRWGNDLWHIILKVSRQTLVEAPCCEVSRTIIVSGIQTLNVSSLFPSGRLQGIACHRLDPEIIGWLSVVFEMPDEESGAFPLSAYPHPEAFVWAPTGRLLPQANKMFGLQLEEQLPVLLKLCRFCLANKAEHMRSVSSNIRSCSGKEGSSCGSNLCWWHFFSQCRYH